MEEKVNDDHYGDVIGLNKGIGRAAAVISPLEVRRACTCFTYRIGQVRAADWDHIVSTLREMHRRILNQNFKTLGAYLFELCCSERDIAFVPIYLPHPVCSSQFSPQYTI